MRCPRWWRRSKITIRNPDRFAARSAIVKLKTPAIAPAFANTLISIRLSRPQAAKNQAARQENVKNFRVIDAVRKVNTPRQALARRRPIDSAERS